MVFPWSLRANGPRRTALGAAIAGLGTCGYTGYGLWSLRGGVPSSGVSAGIGLEWALLIWIAIGAIAGLISGRFRGAPVSGAGAVIGAVLAYLAFSTIFPGRLTPEDSFAVVLTAVVMLPFVAGGHLLGATVANRAQRRAEGRLSGPDWSRSDEP
jgi:hypothetical protein